MSYTTLFTRSTLFEVTTVAVVATHQFATNQSTVGIDHCSCRSYTSFFTPRLLLETFTAAVRPTHHFLHPVNC